MHFHNILLDLRMDLLQSNYIPNLPDDELMKSCSKRVVKSFDSISYINTPAPSHLHPHPPPYWNRVPIQFHLRDDIAIIRISSPKKIDRCWIVFVDFSSLSLFLRLRIHSLCNGRFWTCLMSPLNKDETSRECCNRPCSISHPHPHPQDSSIQIVSFGCLETFLIRAKDILRVAECNQDLVAPALCYIPLWAVGLVTPFVTPAWRENAFWCCVLDRTGREKE